MTTHSGECYQCQVYEYNSIEYDIAIHLHMSMMSWYEVIPVITLGVMAPLVQLCDSANIHRCARMHTHARTHARTHIIYIMTDMQGWPGLQ